MTADRLSTSQTSLSSKMEGQEAVYKVNLVTPPSLGYRVCGEARGGGGVQSMCELRQPHTVMGVIFILSTSNWVNF